MSRAATVFALSDSPRMRRAALLSLMRPAERRVMGADYLSQTFNFRNNQATRWVYLWKRKDKNPQNDKVIGRTTPAVVGRLRDAGLLRRESALRHEGSDTGETNWYPEWPD